MKLKLSNEYAVIWCDACGGSHSKTVTQDRLAYEAERLDREVELGNCRGYTITATGRIER